MKLAIPLTTAFVALATAKKPNKNDECAVIMGSEYGVAYHYFSTGRNCATNSQVGSIEDSIFHNLQRVDSADIPECTCVKYDQGGDWEGWLMYGPEGKVDLSRYCGPSISGKMEWDCRRVEAMKGEL
jgi:hypothetical protein